MMENTDVDAPTEGLAEDLERQREFMGHAVPAYERLLGLLRDLLDQGLEDRLARCWRGRTFSAWYERPLLLLASLRAEALRCGTDHPLHSAIATPEADADSIDAARTRDALANAPEALDRCLRERYVQTNELSRAVTWRWPAVLLDLAGAGAEVTLHDLGASAGLNLVGDVLPGSWQDASGRPLAVDPTPTIAQRFGYDHVPLDPTDPDDARWVRACIWPGQQERLTRLDRALDEARRLSAEGRGIVPIECDLSEAPSRLPRRPTAFQLAYQTIVADYLPADRRATYESGMWAWLEALPEGAGLWATLELAGDEAAPERACALSVHFALDGERVTLALARTHPHPSELAIDEDAVRALRQRFRLARFS